jgi:hypothetical protein
MRFEHLRERLLKGGIAPRHVRRYLRELSDHFDDLALAEREAGQNEEAALAIARARLGAEDNLAAAMLARPELRSWAARLPWLVFGVAPPLAMMAALFALGLPLVLIARADGMMGQAGRMAAPAWFQLLAHVTALSTNLVLGTVVAFLLVTIAERQRLNWKWPVLAIAILAVAGFHMVVSFPMPGQRGGQISIALLAEFARRYTPLLPQTGWMLAWVQILLTLAPLLWLWRAQRFAGPTKSG